MDRLTKLTPHHEQLLYSKDYNFQEILIKGYGTLVWTTRNSRWTIRGPHGPR